MDIPLGGSSFPLLAGWIGIWNVGFVEGGKPEAPEKNPQSKHMNQQQTQPTCDVMPGLQNQTQATPARGECPPPLPFYPFVPPLLVSTNKRLKKIDFKEVWVHFQIVTLNCSSCTLKLRKLIHTCLASCGWVQSTHLRNLVNAWKLKENSSKKFFNYQVL